MFLEIWKYKLARHFIEYQIKNSETNPHLNLDGLRRKGIWGCWWIWAIWTAQFIRTDQKTFPCFSYQNKGIEEIHLLSWCCESGLSLKWCCNSSPHARRYSHVGDYAQGAVSGLLLLDNNLLKLKKAIIIYIFLKQENQIHNKCRLKSRRQLLFKTRRKKLKNRTFVLRILQCFC